MTRFPASLFILASPTSLNRGGVLVGTAAVVSRRPARHGIYLHLAASYGGCYDGGQERQPHMFSLAPT